MIANAFQCYKLADGQAYLTQDFSIKCDAAYVGLMYPAATLALGVYALGIPLLLYWRLREHRTMLRTPAAVYTLGFLYRDYKEEYYWWECAELLRKFLLCGLWRWFCAIACFVGCKRSR